MKNFIKSVLILILFIVFSSIVLDKLYTYIHYNGAPRSKPDFIMGMNVKDSLDFAVFGSSRVLHFIDVKLIESKTKKKGFNFGIPGSSVFEIKLSVQQIIKRKITKNIYIQIDYIWNELYPGGECTVDWLTFINEDDIWNQFRKIDVNNEYKIYKKLPFLRYCKYDSKLGFRELVMSLSNREMDQIKNKGYVPLYGKLKNKNKKVKYELKDEFNIHLKEIIEMCKNQEINLYFFTSPIYNFEGDNSVLKKNLPNYYDFSNTITEDFYYRDNKHLNIEGSKLFTEQFIEKYF